MADSDKLGLGLDDIIRLDRSTNNRRGSGRGGNRGFRSRGGQGAGRPTNNNSNGFRTRGGGGIPRTSNPPVGRWKHDLFENDGNAATTRSGLRTGGVNSTTKLIISNLDYGVTTNDVQELFEDIGAVRIARVHYDEAGRSLGSAEVIFERRADAITAQKKYNNLNLDGRPMDIKLVGGNDNRVEQQSNRPTFNNNNSGGGNFRPRGRGGRGAAREQRNGARNNGKAENITSEDLDADLEAYRAESGAKK